MSTGVRVWRGGWLSLVIGMLLATGGAAAAAGPAAAKAAPAFTSAPPTQAVVREVYTYAVTTSDADAAEKRVITAVARPRWLSLRKTGDGTALLKGRPAPKDVGTHAVTLRVTDASGASAEQQFEIAVLWPAAAAPVFDPPGAADLAEALTVTLTCATPEATIRYTTDGSTPSADTGLVYSAPIEVSGDTTLTAVAFAAGRLASAPVTATYTFLLLPNVQTVGVTATDPHPGEATVAGTVDPRGLPAEAWFEWWWTDPAHLIGQTPPVAITAGAAPVPMEAIIPGLTGGTCYYFRAVASNANGQARGAVQSFALEPLDPAALVVNSTADTLTPPPGKLTLRAAVARVAAGGTITFDPLLDGQTIDLTIIGETASTLRGEVFAMAAGRWEFLGFQERNYGTSALYVDRDLTIDATALPHGIRLNWAGSEATPARVLAVLGNLTLRNVTVSGGRLLAEALAGNATQPFTLARGAGLAVWGTAVLEHCLVADNRAVGDLSASRDRGTFGGGIYADSVRLTDCVVSGNSVTGFGAAGGGIYSVSGAESWDEAVLQRSVVSGNRVTAQHAYGGGVYSDGGGPGNMRPLVISNCTIARNQVEDHPGIAESAMMQYYYRGGGVYMSNGWLMVSGSTLAENGVTGVPAVFSGKPNMGGGGIAATIGNAHVVESMEIWHSIVAGNLVGGVANDLYTGSLVEFHSYGYNRIGGLDFSQMLVPIPAWEYLSRRHWPKRGDLEDVELAQVLNLAGARVHETVLSLGTDAGAHAVLWYPPQGAAVDQITGRSYTVTSVQVGYNLEGQTSEDDFLNLILAKLQRDYRRELGRDFGSEFGDLTGVVWGGEAVTWPSDPQNIPWISFWHDLDTAIGTRLGAARLGDEFWGTFREGRFGDRIWISARTSEVGPIEREETDQLGHSRFADRRGDIGAVERQP